MNHDHRTVLGALAIALAVFVIPAAAAARSDAAQSRVPWKLVYEHYDPRSGEGGAGIDIVTSERQRPLALVRRPRDADTNYREPALSADGQYVAYIRSASDDDLYVVHTDGSARRRVATGVINQFVWSADSSSLAFTVGCGFDFEGGCRKGRIDTILRDGTQRRVLVRASDLGREAEIELQDWSRRGDLLYVVRDRGREQLYAAGETGNAAPAVLANRREDGEIGEASWSSDGRLTAYTRRCTDLRSDTYCDIAVMNREGGSKRTLVRRGPLTGGSWGAPTSDAPTWVPGSRRMLVALWGNDAQTRLVHATTGESRLYSREPLRNIVASRDGARVAALDQTVVGGDRLLIKSLAGSTLERVRLPRDFDVLLQDHDLWIG